MSVEKILDIEDDNPDEIYTDFSFLTDNSFAPIPTGTAGSHYSGNGQQVWGVHESKPEQQTKFEKQLQESLDSVAEYSPYMKELDIISELEDSELDDRPRVFDGELKLWVLVDTGASVSVLPYKMSPLYKGQEPECHRALEAVNGTRLRTYGHEVAKVQIGRKTYEIDYVLADIKQPIIGWNFIKRYKLWTGWNRWGDPMLIYKKAWIYATMRADEDDM